MDQNLKGRAVYHGASWNRQLIGWECKSCDGSGKMARGSMVPCDKCNGACEQIAAMGYKTTSLYEMVCAAERQRSPS